jgi:hypothetical protein
MEEFMMSFLDVVSMVAALTDPANSVVGCITSRGSVGSGSNQGGNLVLDTCSACAILRIPRGQGGELSDLTLRILAGRHDQQRIRTTRLLPEPPVGRGPITSHEAPLPPHDVDALT